MTLNYLRSAIFAGSAVLLWAAPAVAQTDTTPATELLNYWMLNRQTIDSAEPILEAPLLTPSLLAKAEPDECFNGVGQPYPELKYDANGEPYCEAGQLKRNQGYIWGLTAEGGSLYFGTVANTHCGAQQGYLEVTTPQENPYWVCEFGQATSGRADGRPPHLYRYNLADSTLTDVSPLKGTPAGNLLVRMGGIRSAGSQDGIAFLAGPGNGGITIFAFEAATGTLLGATALPEYNDIRQWASVDGVLYAAVGTKVASPGTRAGAVIRWRGNEAGRGLFDFDPVGDLLSIGANIAYHNGRLYVGTWPAVENLNLDTGVGYAGLYRSSEIPAGGFTLENPGVFDLVWDALDYEKDPLAARGYGMGSMASFGGKLFWGTMHVPMSTTTRAFNLNEADPTYLDANGNGTLDQDEQMATILGTHRAISIFSSGSAASGPFDFDVIYGEYYLPIYDAAMHSYTIAYDDAHMNKAKKMPTQGSSGLGNFYNAYTWTMTVFKKQLYIGTFDWRQLARVNGGDETLTAPDVPQAETMGTMVPIEGADFFRIADSSGLAVAESLTGLGNFTNYGVRNVTVEGDVMYVGTANPMNLHPDGGWELIAEELPPWDPTWQQVLANYTWLEFRITGGNVTSAYLEVPGKGTVQLMYRFSRWMGGSSFKIPYGATVILHAQNDLGQTAQTVKFRYLIDKAPETDLSAP